MPALLQHPYLYAKHFPPQGLKNLIRLPQTRAVPSLSILITLDGAAEPQNVGGQASVGCSTDVWGGAGNGASVQGTWEMLGIQAYPTGCPILEEERVMGQSLPEDKPPYWRHKTDAYLWGEKKPHMKLGEAGWRTSRAAGSQCWERR